MIVGFGDYRAELERLAAAARRSSPGRSSTATSSHLLPLADAVRRAVDLPGGVRDGRRRGRRGGLPAARRAALAASPRSPRGSRRSTRRRSATSPRSRPGDVADLRGKLHELLALSPAPTARAIGAAARRARVERWSLGGRGRAPPRARSLAALQRTVVRRWARSSGSPPRSSSRRARERSRTAPTSRSPSRRSSRSSTRRRSGSSNRFEELQAAARGHRARAAPRRRADRLGGRGPHRPLRELRRGGGAMAERRAQLAGARRAAGHRCSAPPARTRGAAGRTSGSSTRRTTAGTTSSCATSSGATTPSGCTSTSGSAAPTARSRSQTRCAASCPSCSRSRRARRSSRRSTPGCTRRGRRSSRASSRAAGSRTRTTAGRGSRTTSASSTTRARSPSTRSSGGACARTSRSRRSRSGSATRSPTSARRRRSRRSPTRSPPGCARALDEGEPLPDCRTGCSRRTSGGRSGTGSPASYRLRCAASRSLRERGSRQLIEWVAPVADEIGAAPFLGVPAANAAERQRARSRRARRWRRSTPSRSQRARSIGG